MGNRKKVVKYVESEYRRLPIAKLTSRLVESAKPGPGSQRLELWDNQLQGFGLRVAAGEKGVRSWFCMYRLAGQQRRLTLGHYPAMSLADARAAAREAFQMVSEGRDPARERKPLPIANPDRLDKMADEFVERWCKGRNRSWQEQHRILDRDVKPRLGDRLVQNIGRREIVELLDAKRDQGATTQANRVLEVVRRLFAWLVERGVVEENPALGIKPPSAVNSRDRVLSDDELGAVWRAFDDEGWPFGPAGRLLILTAARRDEVATMRWRDVDLGQGVWTVPREASKSDRAHEIPLPPIAISMLEEAPRLADAELVFTTTGRSPVQGWSKLKARIDARSGVSGWILHDLRRTTATGLARMGYAPQVVGAILNHSPRSLQGVTAVYNRHSYSAEKRAALEAWARHVEAILNPEAASTVVPLRSVPSG